VGCSCISIRPKAEVGSIFLHFSHAPYTSEHLETREVDKQFAHFIQTQKNIGRTGPAIEGYGPKGAKLSGKSIEAL
jgi:hypothetical protein